MSQTNLPRPNTPREHIARFVRSEFYEILSRIKRDQPRRYAREVSAGTQVAVERYEQLREEHGRPPRRAVKKEGANESREEKTCARPAAGSAARL